MAGGSFSVGTPYVARWFPKNRQGFAMGVYGAGNSGAAVGLERAQQMFTLAMTTVNLRRMPRLFEASG